MELLLKVAGLCLAVAATGALLRREEPAYSLLLSAAAVVLAGTLLFSGASEIMALCEELIALTGLSTALFAPLLKVLAVSLITRVTSSLCADAGQSALCCITEAAGSFCALGCALPLLRAVTDLIRGWL